MKKAIVYFSFLFLLPLQIIAQGCLPDGITFTSQEEIDQFPQMHPNCTEVEGMVIINGANIKNLDSLYTIISIDNSLHIFSCDSLSSLLGLSDLQYLKELTIENNGNLAEISGFNYLASLNGLSIFNNENLLKIDGFMNLDSIDGDFIIRNCSKMIEFDAFDQLQFIGGDLEFIFNTSLAYCPSFNSLIHIGKDLRFIRNNEISDLIGFNSLSIIGSNVVIDNNINLQSISGFSNLTTVGNNFDIKYNTALLDLQGLSSLESIGGDLNIWHNESLQSMEGLNVLNSIEGELSLLDNVTLQSLEPLINLQYLGGLVVQENNALLTLMGLNNVTSIGGGRLYIAYNLMLNSLHGINNIDYQTFGYLSIERNPNLFYCEVESICDWANSITFSDDIVNNAYGCDDLWEVRRACNSIGEDVPLFPVLSGHPTWSVLECDQSSPLHCDSKTYQYIQNTIMCWLRYSMIEIGDDTAYVRSDGPRTYYRTTRGCWQEEYLLYDFSLNVGNTAEVGWNQHLPAGGGVDRKTIVRVADKYTQNYFGEERTTLKIQYNYDNENEGSYMYWVEGIGSLTHPFYPYMDLSEESDNYFELLCLDSLWTPLYQNPDWNVCDTIVDGVEDHEYFDGITISPNPFNSQLKISSTNVDLQQIRVYSITGQLIPYKLQNNGNFYILEFDNKTPKGIYLLQIYTPHKMIQKKVLKI